MSSWVGRANEEKINFHQRIGNISKKYGYMIAVTGDPNRYFLYDPKDEDISKSAIDDFIKEGFSFLGFRLGGSDSVRELEHKKVAEIMYVKN